MVAFVVWMAPMCVPVVVDVNKRRVNAVDGIGLVVLWAGTFLVSRHSWCYIVG